MYRKKKEGRDRFRGLSGILFVLGGISAAPALSLQDSVFKLHLKENLAPVALTDFTV